MIYFNGLELDYSEKTLNKLVLKRAISDIETLGNRKTTSSTTFDVPRTANNEKALNLITTEGVIYNPKGDAVIKIDNNVYAEGTISVKGYDDKTISLLFEGSDFNIIKQLGETPLKETISTKFSELFIGSYFLYSDTHIKNAMSSIVSSQLDYFYSVPQERNALGYSAEILTPFFLKESIIRKMFSDLGYTVVSDFLDTDYASNVAYSDFSGEHLSANLMEGATTNITSLSSDISLGAVSLGGGVTKTGDKYIFVNSATKLKIKMKINVAENEDVADTIITIKAYDSSNVEKFFSTPSYLTTGENYIYIDTDVDLDATDYIKTECTVFLKSGGSLPINYDIVVEDVQLQHDNIQEDDVVLLSDYLGSSSQLDFLKSFLKLNNLVLDVSGDKVYIDCRDNAKVWGEDIIQLDSNTIDITNLIESKKNVSLDYSIKRYILFKQGMLSQSGLNEIELNEFSTIGSWYTDLNLSSIGVETYDTIFNSCYNGLDGYNLSASATEQPANLINIGVSIRINDNLNAIGIPSDPIGFLESWENFITVPFNPFGTYRDTTVVDYTNLDATTSTPDKYAMYVQMPRFDMNRRTSATTIFTKTLARKNNNKIEEVELYDHQGTLINFRTKFIIDNLVYKLLDYQFEPVSKKVIAKIILE